jgi:outer membrane protein assembly factor BamB
MKKTYISLVALIVVCVLSARSADLECGSVLKDSGVSGGLALVVGTWDKNFCKELVTEHPFLLHVLLSDGKKVEEARKALTDMGIYGRVTAGEWDGKHLPVVPRSAKLILSTVSLDKAEIQRVLAPLGAAIVEGKTTRAPWPDSIDEWTHFLHGPDNNAVGLDKEAGPPRHVRWMAGPRYLRHHGMLASMSALVSARGRLFYIYDRGPTFSHRLPPVWQLEARDAFSGVNLWTRTIDSWAYHRGPFRHGPTELPRRLTAFGDRLFVTLGYEKPVSVLNAVTGETIRDLSGTEDTLEILCVGDVLYLVKGKTENWDEARKRKVFPSSYSKSIVAVNWRTGKIAWTKDDKSTELMMPTTLAVSDGRAFYQNTREIICLNAGTGEEEWKTARLFGGFRRGGWGTPTLVVAGSVVLCAERNPGGDAKQDKPRMESISDSNRPCKGDVIAYSVEDGKELWRCVSKENYNSPIDVLVVDGKVWTGDVPIFNNPGFTEARDLLTGVVSKKRGPDQDEIEVGMYHHRCYRVKATEKYLFLSRAGTELLDVNSGKIEAHHWVRGSCQYGLLPCNGLLYATPHACACYVEAKLTGFAGLAPAGDYRDQAANIDTAPLFKGPAYGGLQGTAVKPAGGDWPTYRADPARSGRAACKLPKHPVETWRVAIPGSKHLTSIVSVDDMVLGADVDAHGVFCLDTATGTIKWQRVVGGPVDSPPTIVRAGSESLCLFGCRDGNIYCLRASDGELVWRYRAAPRDRLMVSRQKLESVWPVHGSVLADGGRVYSVAGRSSFLDGGLRFTALDAVSGKVLSDNTVYSGETGTGKQPREAITGFYMTGALPDILASDGKSIFMRHLRMDMKGNPLKERVPHIFSPAGFLDDQWWNRTYWLVGRKMGTGYKHWHTIAPLHVRGRILVTDGADTFYGYRRKLLMKKGARGKGATFGIESETGYELFRAAKETGGKLLSAGTAPREPKITQPFKHSDNWTKDIPIHARALVLGDSMLAVAGRPDPYRVKGEVYPNDGMTSKVMVFSTADGADSASAELGAEPVFDGMIASRGKLFAALINGEVVCFNEASH